MPGRAIYVVAAALLAASALHIGSASNFADAASPSPPASDASITLTAEPMLGGRFKAGSWAAFRVLVENHGPAVDGELRLSGSVPGSSTYGRTVQLASGARQEHVLYGLMGPFAGRFTIALVSGDATLASVNAQVQAANTTTPDVYVIAERPQALVGPIDEAIDAVGSKPAILTISPEQLPPRAEAWSSADVLVWQDVESNRLDAERSSALRTWVATGGHLIICAGSTGVTTLGAFPADLLPYRPQAIVDVPRADLEAFVGALPPDASDVPALTGTLERGAELARSGPSLIAARAQHGQGSVTLVGIDPATPWIAASPAANVMWSKVLPSNLTSANRITSSGDDFIVNALNNLPAVQLPSITQLALLLVAYIVAIGPINYLILRRRDRREWAWVTMPATIVVFAIGTYLFGSLLRGSNVVVNELAIVHGATGADSGLAQIYIGVYSPSRSTFDVKVGGNALISAPAIDSAFNGENQASRPVDVLLGDPATLRDYSVGFGVLRGFRAEATLAAPRVDADLRLIEGRLEGTITNATDAALDQVSVVYRDSFQTIGDLAAGQSHAVSFSTEGRNDFDFGDSMADRLFPHAVNTDADGARRLAARRAIVRHLSGGWNEFGGITSASAFASGPVILAWRSGETLDIDVGTAADHVGERLFLLRARVAIAGPVSFTGNSLPHTTLELEGIDAFEEGGIYGLGRGTITAEYRATGFDGTFHATALTIQVGERTARPARTGDVLAPLPVDEQPDSDQPLAVDPQPDAAGGVPRIQLIDRVSGEWVEFEAVSYQRTYSIADPARYVDDTGAFRVRFVARDQSEFLNFAFGARLDGTVD